MLCPPSREESLELAHIQSEPRRVPVWLVVDDRLSTRPPLTAYDHSLNPPTEAYVAVPYAMYQVTYKVDHRLKRHHVSRLGFEPRTRRLKGGCSAY